MLGGLLAILFCQLLGEILVLSLDIPVPGAVVGMLLLLIALMVQGEVATGLRTAGEGLLKYLPLMLVPSGVGLMVHLELIARDWLAIVLALVLSTVVTFVVTALLMERLKKPEERVK
ncbi:MAG: CidA/LrgA family protein [Marinobacterium sp.]|nr:CidA/LrgA family protein [Marinobacterium sp.]